MKVKITLINGLLLALLGTSMAVHAMEEVISRDITLRIGDQEYTVSLDKARLSGTLVDLIEDAGIDTPLPLTGISGEDFTKTIELVDELYPLLEKKDTTYIPRVYQPTVNANVVNLTNEQLGKLITAADFLALPYIQNALAAVVADQVYGMVNPQETIKSALTRLGFGNQSPGNISFVEKHLTFREKGITEEYSIADFLDEGKSPKKIEKIILRGGRGLAEAQSTTSKELPNSLALENEGLTSLFGIDRLDNKETTTFLSLNDNCFYQFDLDVQGVEKPFEDFTSLESLDLINTCLVRFSPTLVTGIKELKNLDLGANNLNEINKTNIRNALPGVTVKFVAEEGGELGLGKYWAKRVDDRRN